MQAVEEDGHILRLQPHDGFLDPLPVEALLLRRPHVLAEPVEGLIDGIDGLVTDPGHAVSPSRRVTRHEGVRLLGLVLLALLGPLELLGLDGDEAVGGDAVIAA